MFLTCFNSVKIASHCHDNETPNRLYKIDLSKLATSSGAARKSGGPPREYRCRQFFLSFFEVNL